MPDTDGINIPRLRDYARPGSDGKWESVLNAIFNKELYPAIKALSRIMITIREIINPLTSDNGFITWLGPETDARGDTPAAGTTITAITLEDGLFYTLWFGIWVKDGSTHYVYRAIQEAYRDGAGAVLLGDEVITSEAPTGGDFSVAWSAVGNEIRATLSSTSGNITQFHRVITFTSLPVPA